MHVPVLLKEVITLLDLRPGNIVLDGTVGSGGHAEAIMRVIGSTGYFIGLDQDEQAIARSRERLNKLNQPFILKHSQFGRLDEILVSLNMPRVDAVLLDVGFCLDQIEDAGRGFSFLRDGPLDMRMDQTSGRTAAELIHDSSEEELSTIFYEYGEERHARSIARAIVRERTKKEIQTTKDLAELIFNLTPARFRYGRIHPATRVFQALRIAVNDELNQLTEALPKAFDSLVINGKLSVISFHSLEDRIVKHFFKRMKTESRGVILTKKPVCPGEEEILHNSMSRSAKLRVIKRVK
ncbi:MAG: 16S rRNA (cytosine(1402)-N(4))-methyltransferase [Omnitrophica bacterium RIFCSPLOWO2_12_FULL_44_17]|uniref:Ribosomal RNA small subunit methyltransferase H n=1 Tax=Candidatus Danuiimicrobium aquiferis TaxID=1801832 RepID=A0A1G1KRM2_9BACT|nr:MAG: 16S rRNA (cytosine(1402)-N(4))-methyltransferase [Omnitrophica bacterium RIFCSPHIGHO2_02_FULL_45_28]OGW91209.1 MAG: 16S rRNA (cytosine(1402)-N(4))-methyltransferase [Omnitrophica bacterium RIFCSPHIGHO2_12_FULL_44_12]OGW95610.1 MAG: 16S rRNA (cytosine(1402)-N(4))-methyltransferase [Omnitrophica bacterium RIFCSPLOWO2_12_FULL_44_17]OGX03677.1 MAG: 16S rRNA (cytosine(1402)-N(4))-methyltransferase [Omnitrophica bacterium RIFCSPLOWO2_02_FULL_44_11]